MLLICVLVGAIWGLTNVLMKVSTKLDSDSGWSLTALAKNWKYIASLGLNQSASVLFLWTLADASLSIAVPLTNTVTFLAAAVAGWALNGEKMDATTLLAMSLMSVGIYLCVTSG